MAEVNSVGELGDMLGVQSWRIARLYELGLVPEPPRCGGRRLVPKTHIPLIVEQLRIRGWLPIKDRETPP
jgi:hypothetical protein